MKHVMNIDDLSKDEVLMLVDKAIEIKANPEKYAQALGGKTLLMMFEKPSLRTRVSFETGMTKLGGHAIFYSFKDSPLGKKESISDTAKAGTRYVDIVMVRAYSQQQIREFADNSRVPVIDALSDNAHPCQILADLQTMKEKGKAIENMKFCYLGNGNNNVTFDLMRACALLGATCHVGCPDGEEFNVPQRVIDECANYPGKVVVTHDAAEAAKDADVVYTDTWVNYGVPLEEMEAREKVLMPYQVNAEAMSHAKPDAIFMNCLPAMREKEQSAEVIDGPQSVVFDEAENRMWAQNALMLFLLDKL
ncbi:ornithine carbamoyltransferase [archaeon]